MPRFRLCAALLLFAFVAIGKDKAPDPYPALRDKLAGGDLTIDFAALRFACLNSENCSVDADRDTLQELEKALAADQYGRGFELVRKLLAESYASIETHMAAERVFQLKDETFTREFHHAVVANLIRSILSSGDGKSFDTAFKVASVHEEYIVLSVMGKRPGSQSLVNNKNRPFDVLEPVDPKTSEKTTLYFNISAFFGK